MRLISLVTCVLTVFACASCGSTSTPVSPSASTFSAAILDGGSEPAGSATGTTGGTPAAIGMSGVVRGLEAGSTTFSLATRAGTRLIHTDRETQVWNKGTRVRLSALTNGQPVSVRGYDYARYVLARTISVN